MNIALTGARGLVGSRVAEILNEKGHHCIPLTSEDLDITNAESVQSCFATLDAELVIHLAAYTNVDGAELEPEKARLINVEGTRHVYDAATRRGMKYIQISTDFVFDGTRPPYDENSTPHPQGVYAKTKWEAEQYLFSKADNYQLPPNAMIVRITYPYRLDDFAKKDFVRTIKSLLEKGTSIGGITDSLITPTWIDDIAHALDHLVTHFKNDVYHVVGSEALSPHDVFQLIAKKWRLDPSLITPVTFDTYFAGKAPRPKLGHTTSIHNDFYPMHSIRQILQ
jgi:dTDP-4-dehydrorhamnose reductase